MSNSWLSEMLKPTHPKRDDDHRNRMPLATIPPPISQSIYLPSRDRTSPREQRQNQIGIPWYARKQQQFEADLQVLLDAQAEGLLSGLQGEQLHPALSPGDDVSSNGSSTPTLRGTLVAKSPESKNISLRNARKGLYTTMCRLSLLKAEEAKDTQARFDDVNTLYDQVQSWIDRQGKLQARMEGIEDAGELQSAKDSRDKASALQPEIDKLEERLRTLRLEQQRLIAAARDVENRVQHKLTLYKRGLDELDRDVGLLVRDIGSRPLKKVIIAKINESTRDQSTGGGAGSSRLQRVHDAIRSELDAAQAHCDTVQSERDALDEGAALWKDIVGDVESFERHLQHDLLFLASNAPDRAGQADENLRQLLQDMDDVQRTMQDKLDLSSARGWNLLVAAIGAELEAFQEGRRVLTEALESTGHLVEDENNGFPLSDSVDSARRIKDSAARDSGKEILELDNAFRGAQVHDGDHEVHEPYHDDDTDDGPDPELLISHHDTDDE